MDDGGYGQASKDAKLNVASGADNEELRKGRVNDVDRLHKKGLRTVNGMSKCSYFHTE